MADIEVRDSAVSTRKITFFIALTLFAQESAWNFYDNQVPVLLREHVTSAALVGALMGMDNLLGIVIQPWIGNRSDNTRTRWGRRVPYLAVGMPLAAVLFVFLPWTTSAAMLIAVMVGYALVANTMRPLAESLVPDFIPPARRSRTNAIVKIAAALTIIVASLISLLVVDDHPRGAFVIPSVILLLVTVVMIVKVRDSRSAAYRAAVAEDATAGPGETRVPFRRVIIDLVTDPDRRRLLLLLTILLFGGAWFASRSLVTPYGMEALGLSRGDAGGLTLPSGIAEPGEEMAFACAREVLEETGVVVEVEELISIKTVGPVTYPNDDVTSYVDHFFRCRPTGGTAQVGDDESIAVGWFATSDLPEPGTPRTLSQLAEATAQGATGRTRFTV